MGTPVRESVPEFEQMKKEKRGQMNLKSKAAAATMLAVCLVAVSTSAQEAKAPATKHPLITRTAAPAPATMEEQIQSLRQELTTQIDGLKKSLADKDEALQKAQQAAAEAQAAAEKAQAAANAQNQAVTDNTAAVTTLQSTVTDLKANAVSLATTVSDETAKIKKDIASPATLHYKGITIAPYGFINGETVYRSKATGGELATPFSSIPYEKADGYSMSEMYITGRQSRLGVNFEGKTDWGTMRAIVEGDFLGVGTTSNDNQSTSYVFRQRVALGEVETKNGWTVSAGQGWSLVAENKKGITTMPSNVALPNQIDPNYVTGLAWARSGGIRLTKSFKSASFAVSAENPQLLYTASLAGNTPYSVVGSAGVGGGLLNQAISACTPSTSIVNYTNEAEKDANGVVVNVAVPVYKTVNGCANLANISFNKAPDMVVKTAVDTKYGHYELFGVARFFHQTVYPGETTNSNLYGGLKDIKTGLVVAPALSAAGAVSNSTIFGGIGGSVRIPIQKFVVGGKVLYGPGVGHFGDSTLSDATSNAWGGLSPIHNMSGLLTVEANPTPRLNIYAYYGGDYAGREDYSNAGTTSLGAPSAAQSTAGLWGGTWGAPSQAAVGYGSRMLSNSACNTITNPGYNGGASTGYAAGGSCGAQTRNVQEATGGYWYDIYKGDKGRLRQGLQYGYTVREGWSGVGGIGAKGIDNMVFTSLRYYLP